ncbi:hypothetical protein C5167_004519 [Papaver somniferum]|uniref:Uncharacterized protein n=1 Tax=Papaver somniferum TaxID=3469 RepID=A0A4Y7J7V5_PAPSO|nr:hypothetical protein C5167_004519 [Papaver somniferum]
MRMLISCKRKSQHQMMNSNIRRKCLSLHVSEPFHRASRKDISAEAIIIGQHFSRKDNEDKLQKPRIRSNSFSTKEEG